MRLTWYFIRPTAGVGRLTHGPMPAHRQGGLVRLLFTGRTFKEIAVKRPRGWGRPGFLSRRPAWIRVDRELDGLAPSAFLAREQKPMFFRHQPVVAEAGISTKEHSFVFLQFKVKI